MEFDLQILKLDTPHIPITNPHMACMTLMTAAFLDDPRFCSGPFFDMHDRRIKSFLIPKCRREPHNFDSLAKCFQPTTIWMFPKIGVPQKGWFIVENPIKIHDLGVPLFLERPIWKVTFFNKNRVACRVVDLEIQGLFPGFRTRSSCVVLHAEGLVMTSSQKGA